jgi:hypothetical protein
VACDAVRFLVKYLAAGSAQTREAAARALRQICVDVSVRGAVIQQGGLKACCSAACDEDNKVRFWLVYCFCFQSILRTFFFFCNLLIRILFRWCVYLLL